MDVPTSPPSLDRAQLEEMLLAGPDNEVHLGLLGGEAEDPEVLEDLVWQLNRVYVSSGVATVRAIGECVVRMLAGGNKEAFRRGARRHATYAALVRHKGLKIKPKVLSLSVQIYLQLDKLPPHIANELSPTDHRLLLGVKDDAERLEIATYAVVQQFTSRQLEEEIARRRGTTPQTGPGRKAEPKVVKDLRALPKLTARLRDADVAGLDPDLAETLVASIDEQQAALARLRAALERLYTAEDA